jgi:hypothetical protein
LLNLLKRRMNIANSFPRGLISTMMALSKISEGGGQPGGMFLFTYRTDLLEYFVGKKQIEKTCGGFFWFV